MSSSASSVRSRVPGDMTLAMRAVRGPEGAPRVLRIGVIQGTRVIEERVMRGRDAVTVGTHERNTFTLGDDDALPAHLPLFVRNGEGYALRVSPGVSGRVLVGDRMVPLATREAPGSYDIALDDHSRGKITLGVTTFLFQFVAPPPVQPRAQLPVAIRSHALSSVDWTYNAFIAAFLALAFGGVTYVEYGYDPPVEDAFEIPPTVSWVASVLPPPAVEALPASAGPSAPTNAPSSPATTPSPSHAPAAAQTPSHRNPTETAEHTADAAYRALERLAHFDPIVGVAPEGTAASAVDRLFNGHDMHDTQRDLAMLGGIDRGHDTTLGVDRRHLVAMNGPHDDGLTRGHRIDAPVGPVTDGTTQNLVARVPATHLAVEAPSEAGGTGDLPPDEVAAVVRRNLGAVRWCYNEAIRQAPSLSGRLEVHFTLGESGRVIGVPQMVGFDESPTMRSCVATRFRGFAFPQPVGGTVDFVFPFVFSSGQ